MDKPVLEFEAGSVEQTDRFGRALGRALSPGLVLGLTGTLGAGKTRLTQAIGHGLEIAPDQIVSPTYTLMVPHSGRLIMMHLDAYRIGSPTEVDELGLDEMVVDGAVLIVEWAERIENLLPPMDVRVLIQHVGDQARKFTLTACSAAGTELIRQLESGRAQC